MTQSDKFSLRLPKITDGIILEDLLEDDPSKYGHRRIFSLDPDSPQPKVRRAASRLSTTTTTTSSRSRDAHSTSRIKLVEDLLIRDFKKIKSKSQDSAPNISAPPLYKVSYISQNLNFESMKASFAPLANPADSAGTSRHTDYVDDANYLDMALEKNGCKILQSNIDSDPKHWCPRILKGINGKIVQISANIYGNFLIQKIIEKGSTKDRAVIIRRLTPDSYCELSQSKYGTRVMQNLVTVVGKTNEIELQKILVGLDVECLMVLQSDLLGGYVITKSLEFFDIKVTQRLRDKILENAVDISLDKQGCCMIQKVMAIEKRNPSYLSLLGDVLGKDYRKLLNSPYGNYVVQVMIEQGLLRQGVMKEIARNVYEYSKLKFSSNVIEKVLKTRGVQQIVFKEYLITNISRLSVPELEDLIMDRFGNYVIQSMLLMWNRDRGLFSRETEIQMNGLRKRISNIVKKKLKKYKKSRSWLLNINDLI